MPPSNSQGRGSQPSQASEKEERQWVLKDCTMEVTGIGKKDPVNDDSMTIDLIFTFDDDPSPKVVELLHNPDSMKNAWTQCCNQLDRMIFLEDCSHRETK